MKWLKNLFSEDTRTYVAGYVPGKGSRIRAHEEYLSITVHVLKITKIRVLTKKFYGAVHGVVEIAHEDGNRREFQIFDTLSEMKKLDPENLDKIIQGPYELLKSAPYRGGGIDLAVALFSIEATDLAAPYLTMLNGLASATSLTIPAGAKPFVDVLTKGVSAIVGGDRLEVGRDAYFDSVEAGYYAIVAAESKDMKLKDLEYDPEARELKHKGNVIEDHPHMVLHVRGSPTREDWTSIPALAAALERLKAQIVKTPQDTAVNREAFDAFRVTLDVSGDLLPPHAQAVCGQVNERFARYLDEERMSAAGGILDLDAVDKTKLESFDPFVD